MPGGHLGCGTGPVRLEISIDGQNLSLSGQFRFDIFGGRHPLDRSPRHHRAAQRRSGNKNRWEA
jgi:hypothetical protein